MDKTAIKNYAIWARVNLIEAAKQRAYQYEITKDSITDANADVVSGKPLSKDEKEQRRQLIDQIKQKGFDQVMEEVAYTWFNRFIALRFMEVNGYLPTKIRVFTDSEGNFKPEILKEALTVELPVDKARVMELLEKQDNEELYKMLLIAQCNELSNGLPDIFEVISNYTELLFPNNLLKEDSILGEMVNTIPEEDWTDAVQIIGWLYQYYNSELKDETFALLKKNVKISKERLPAATQLFTPDWIVRYMVENSLGRLWYEGHPNDEIKKEWKYYLDEAQQEPEVEEQLKSIREEYKTIKPEDIKVIDPCMGSGHILVYAFDVLMQIYTSAGWSERDAAESILENNLFGLDIDDRAGQLAYFAVMMKARKYSRRILSKNIRPKVYSIQESNNVKIEAWWRLGPEEDIARRLVQDLTDAKEYGSILNLSVTTDELKALKERLNDIEEMSDQGNLLDVIQSDEITRQLYTLVELAEVMVQKYDVVVTNPPYMSSGNMDAKLQKLVNKVYPNAKSDLYAVFLERTSTFLSYTGYCSIITMHTWMFLSRYEKYRYSLSTTFINMLHLGARAFDDISGEVVQTVSFTYTNYHLNDYKGTYYRLVDYPDEKSKANAVINKECMFVSKQDDYMSLPGKPIAYWVTGKELEAFNNAAPLKSIAQPRVGAITGNNDKFIKSWWEVDIFDICFTIHNYDESVISSIKWYPYNKGGTSRNWFGNRELVVMFRYGGKDIIEHAKSTGCFYFLGAEDVFFHEGITWNGLASNRNTFRFSPEGTLFDSNKGPMLFPKNRDEGFYLLGLFNTKVSQRFLSILNPSISLQAGDFEKMPVVFNKIDLVTSLVKDCVDLATDEWNQYELSWDFKVNPLI